MIRNEPIKAAIMQMKSANQAIFASKLIGVATFLLNPNMKQREIEQQLQQQK